MGDKYEYYYAFRNILHSGLLKKDTKCKTDITLITQAILYEYGGWAFTRIDFTYLKGRF
jgi:hypothetical protein